MLSSALISSAPGIRLRSERPLTRTSDHLQLVLKRAPRPSAHLPIAELAKLRGSPVAAQASIFGPVPTSSPAAKPFSSHPGLLVLSWCPMVCSPSSQQRELINKEIRNFAPLSAWIPVSQNPSSHRDHRPGRVWRPSCSHLLPSPTCSPCSSPQGLLSLLLRHTRPPLPLWEATVTF